MAEVVDKTKMLPASKPAVEPLAQPLDQASVSKGARGPAGPGTLLGGGRYQVVKLLGEGRFGWAYLAKEAKGTRQVALKELRAGAESGRTPQLISEATKISGLSHEGLAKLLEVFEEPERGPIMVSEYVEGGNLESAIRQRGKMASVEAVSMFADIAAGLAVAHARGIIHGDIKPENILMSAPRRSKLVDFGLLGLAGAPGDDPNRGDSRDYLSPEVRQSPDRATPASDVYAVGLCLYYAVTGSSPNVVRMERVMPPVRALVDQCLNDSPTQRFKDGAALAKALDDLLAKVGAAELGAKKSPGSSQSNPGLKPSTSTPAMLPPAPSPPAAQAAPRPASSTALLPHKQERGRRGWVLALALVVVVGAAAGAAWMKIGGSGAIVPVPLNDPEPAPDPAIATAAAGAREKTAQMKTASRAQALQLGEDALAAWNTVLELDPGNEEAAAGVRELAGNPVIRVSVRQAHGQLVEALRKDDPARFGRALAELQRLEPRSSFVRFGVRLAGGSNDSGESR